MGQHKQSGSTLERARLAAGLSLPEVATALVRHPVSVRRYETGRTHPPEAVVLAMARLYGCPASELVGA